MDNKSPQLLTKLKQGTLLLALISPLVILVSSQVAIHSDRNADLISHTQCEILNKEKSSKKYKVQTSCGDFETHSSNYHDLQAGDTYDFQATPGNWARKARIMQWEEVIDTPQPDTSR